MERFCKTSEVRRVSTVQDYALPSWPELAKRVRQAGVNGDETGLPRTDHHGWTRRILRDMASHPGTVPYVDTEHDLADAEIQGGDHMIDLVWFYEPAEGDETGQRKTYRGLALALECEWDGTKEEFWEDFVKLADVSASRRLFVGSLDADIYAQLEDDEGDLTCEIGHYLANHVHFRGEDEVLVTVWNQANDDFLARLFDGHGATKLVDPSA